LLVGQLLDTLAVKKVVGADAPVIVAIRAPAIIGAFGGGEGRLSESVLHGTIYAM